MDRFSEYEGEGGKLASKSRDVESENKELHLKGDEEEEEIVLELIFHLS